MDKVKAPDLLFKTKAFYKEAPRLGLRVKAPKIQKHKQLYTQNLKGSL